MKTSYLAKNYNRKKLSFTKGKGAYLDNRRIRVSKINKMSQALIGTGFPYRSDDEVDIYTPQLAEVTKRAAGVRRAGSAALDLAYVACCRFDLFFEYSLQPWDIAAGLLLVQEAGGTTCSFSGDKGAEVMLSGEETFAAAPGVTEEGLAVIRTAFG